MTNKPKTRVALIGECMLELQGQAFGAMTQGFGGDTLNTAVYLARCGGAALDVSYATALGDDRFSSLMMEAWAHEGIGLDLVRRLPGRLPGLYMIELNEAGERSFSYWRDSAAARDYFNVERTPLEERAAEWDALYLSGISLAILAPAARERLFALMRELRARGAQVVFDNNYRPRLWPDAAVARACFERAFELASVALVTADDHQLLFGAVPAEDLVTPELVIKRGSEATRVREAGGAWQEAATEAVPRVVDTTAAGDSFAAGYLARRLTGAPAVEAARFGNRLAARVIQHRGALIERAAMADLLAG
jgi:2-dehydro-3-deoxygluconokinase